MENVLYSIHVSMESCSLWQVFGSSPGLEEIRIASSVLQ